MDLNIIKTIMEAHQVTVNQLMAKFDDWMMRAVRAEATLKAEMAHAHTIIQSKDEQIRLLMNRNFFIINFFYFCLIIL